MMGGSLSDGAAGDSDDSLTGNAAASRVVDSLMPPRFHTANRNYLSQPSHSILCDWGEVDAREKSCI
jgi:hypothetical protein